MTPQNNRTLVSKSALSFWRVLFWMACALSTSLLPAQVTINNAVPVTAIDPPGGAAISYQNPNWSTTFTNYTAENFSPITAATMGATSGANVLNFEATNGFPQATQSLTSSGTAFSASNTIAPFVIANALTTINTSTGYSIGVQYATFNTHNNILGTPNASQGVFLVQDRTANDTMTSGTQGLVAGAAYGTDPGGTLLTFDRNMKQFSAVLKANSLGTTDVIALFDSNGVLIAKYTIGIAAGQALYFGIQSPSSLIRSVWIGQSTATNGLIIDDIAFVPAPAPAQAPLDYPFDGSAGLTGWYHTSGATLTTTPTYLSIAGSNWDSKIYRGISLQAGTYTMTGTASGPTIVQISTSLSSPPYVSLNLNQTSGWRTDSTTFTTTGATLYLMVKVNAASGTANIDSLHIAATTPTPYTINTTALQTQKNGLSRVRGMDSTWNPNPIVLGAAYFTELKNWGCNVVRLQLHPVNNATSQSAFWTAWPTYLSATIQNIQQAQAAGLKVVIDLHEMPVFPPSGQDPWTDPSLGNQFALVWQSIVQAVVSNNLTSAVWGYELLNEPIDTAQLPNVPRQWIPLAKNLINTIRTIDANTWIIFDVGPGGDFGGFTNLTPLPDPGNRIIYSAHFYNPQAFCLQGIPNTGYPQGATYNATNTNLATYLAPADNFQASWPVPIYIGEFSAARWSPIPDSKNWLTDVVALLEARNWSWCYFAWEEYNAWDLNRDNSFTPSNPPPYLSDSNRTDRGQVIYNALQKNNSP